MILDIFLRNSRIYYSSAECPLVTLSIRILLHICNTTCEIYTPLKNSLLFIIIIYYSLELILSILYYYYRCRSSVVRLFSYKYWYIYTWCYIAFESLTAEQHLR